MLILSFLFILLCFCYISRKRTMSVLKRSGIPGPKPNFILGNVLQMLNIPPDDYQKQLIQKYGKIVGFYIGVQPVILVTDTELIKHIQNIDFKIFADRPHKDNNFILYEKILDGNLSAATGERWKLIRKLMASSLSPLNLKSMTPLIEKSVDTFINIIEENSKKGVEFNFYPLAQRLVSELTIRITFGIENNIQTDNKNQLFDDVQEFMETPRNMSLYVLANCFAWSFPLIMCIRRIHYFSRKSIVRICKIFSQVIKSRKDSSKLERNDLLQALIESTIDGKDDKLGNFERLTEKEVIANAFMIYAGTYDTTSITLSILAHILVNFPEVQEKARQEIQELYKCEGQFGFKEIDSGLSYLENVIKETLRLYHPLINLTSRQCLQDYKYNGMTIPKGSTVTIAISSLHLDEKYWPDSESFNPNRFSSDSGKKIIPFSYQAFGEGPRKCIGMRFAFLELKLVFAKILHRYRLERGPNTEVGKLKRNLGMGALYPMNGVLIKAVKI